MPSGKMFVQANISTILWDYTANIETLLPDMPGQVARVYPASGAVAMLPLTPANGYNPTILFCGGSDMPADAYGDYASPAIDTWLYPASRDCQRITPEPTDGSAPVYVQDDEMIDTRTMGQFINLPDGKLLVVNGAQNGTAGYADHTRQTPSLAQMPFAMSLAAGPVLTPSIYDPDAAPGSRWSSAGLSASTIPRLYHSSAILLPDASVLIAGSNPNVDVNLTVPYPTTYKAEIFYPPYFSATTRPVPTDMPMTISYGGTPFDITVPASSYSGSANDAADKTKVSLVRGGFTTHAMNMGQRYMQLNNTYTVTKDGSIILHVAQAPPNANIFQPGPAFLFVVVKGIPSNGSFVIVGNGEMGPQPLGPVSSLPANIRLDSASGSAKGSSATKVSTGLLVGIIAGVLALLAIIGAVFFVCRRRRRTPKTVISPPSIHPPSDLKPMMGARDVLISPPRVASMGGSDSSMNVPLRHSNASTAWNSAASLSGGRYPQDGMASARNSGYVSPIPGTPQSAQFDPYQNYRSESPRMMGGNMGAGRRF